MMGPPAPYFCIHCSHSAPQVYKTYANGNLIKLLNCRGCGELIDRYVEFDYIIVAINLILQNPLAFRHVLLNSAFAAHWKLGVVFLFIEAYCYWCFRKGVEYETNTSDFYELEINFYRVLIRTILSTFLFHSLVLMTCFIRKKLHPKQIPLQFSYHAVWKGLCLSGFVVIFELAALIWSYSHDHNRTVFVVCLYIMTNAQCYSVCTGLSYGKTFTIIVICYLTRKFCLNFFDELICI